MKYDKEFINTLEDNIRKRKAIDKLISDLTQVKKSRRVYDVLGTIFIDDYQSKSHREY